MKRNLSSLIRRECLGYWLNDHAMLGQGAEVGSAQGIFARQVMSQWHGIKLYMIDPWQQQARDVYRENTNDSDFNLWYSQVQEFSREEPRVVLFKMLSVDAAKHVPDDSLQWVYIDGNHSYGHVMQDMDAWWPKLKMHGLFSGHDHLTNTTPPAFIEVEPAVRRWMKEHDLPYQVTPCTSWWAIKTHP